MLSKGLTQPFLLAQDKRGQQLFEEGRYSAVLDHYTRNYKNGLSSPDIRLMCSSMLRLGLVEDALEMTQRVYMNKPDDPDIVLAMSEALLYNKQYATAYYLLAELSEDMEFEEEDLIEQARNFSYKKFVENTKLKNMDNCTRDMENLFEKIFEVDPAKRIKFG